jgi:hypothetical protein
MRPFIRQMITATLMASTAALCSCSASEDEDQAAAAAAEPAVDSRYATAEALVAQFNAMTTKDPIDMAGANALMYAENARQRTLVDIVNIMVPLFPLNDLMEERFKQPLDPTRPTAFLAKANGPATITQNQGDRATATYKEHDGRTETLQLVKYNGRWWISGYTLEHDPDLKNVSDDDIAFMRIIFRGMASVAPSVTRRIKSGELKTANAARQALQYEAGMHAAKNPADLAELQKIIGRNPKYAAMGNAIGGKKQP